MQAWKLLKEMKKTHRSLATADETSVEAAAAAVLGKLDDEAFLKGKDV